MKLNLIIPSFYPAVIYGGPIFSTFNACKELAKFDDVDVYVSTTNTNMTSKLDVEVNKWLKLENFYVKYYDETIIGKFSWSLFKGIKNDIKNADIIHIQAIFNAPTPISLFWAKYYKKPILLSPRGSLGEWGMIKRYSIKKKWLDFFIKPFAQYVIWHATSEQEKEKILSYFPNAKIIIIPNGIDLKEFKYVNKLSKKEFLYKFSKVNINNINKVITSMGRIQKIKGFDVLIQSFEKFLKKYPDSYLLIAGPDEGEKENLLNQINNLNLQSNVLLIGNISGKDKIDFFANADLFVLPSHNENFGNVYIESLAAGTPIVASKNTPWQEVEEYKCGKWVDNTVDEVYKAMIEIFDSNLEEMSENAKFLAQKYDWSNIALEFKKCLIG